MRHGQTRFTRLASRRTSALTTLQTTDLAHDFAPVVGTLQQIFRALHTGGQNHVTRLFLQALNNRFGIVVSQDAHRQSPSSFTGTRASLADVQSLPTTHGTVILNGGNHLQAWRVTPEWAEVGSIELNALRSYLKTGKLPQMRYEVIGGGDTTQGWLMRDLAGFAIDLRAKDTGIRPLAVTKNGATTREWTQPQLRRLGVRSPHCIREHLRKLPHNGGITTVSEHARYGAAGWANTSVRIRLL